MSAARALLALCIVAAACDAKLAFRVRRSYSSGSATTSGSTTASASGMTSGSTTAPPPATPAPTPSPTEAGGARIVQVVTMSSPLNATSLSTYGSSGTGLAYANLVNFGYGSSIGIVTSSTASTAYKTGCSVTSVPAIATRRSANLSITFTAIVSAAEAASATSASQSLTAASLTSAVAAVLTNLKTSNSGTYGSLTAPTASAVAAPTVTGGSSTSGVSTNTVSMFTVFTAAAVALAQH